MYTGTRNPSYNRLPCKTVKNKELPRKFNQRHTGKMWYYVARGHAFAEKTHAPRSLTQSSSKTQISTMPRNQISKREIERGSWVKKAIQKAQLGASVTTQPWAGASSITLFTRQIFVLLPSRSVCLPTSWGRKRQNILSHFVYGAERLDLPNENSPENLQFVK